MGWNPFKSKSDETQRVSIQFLQDGIALSAMTTSDFSSVFITAPEDERIPALKKYIQEQQLQYSPCSIVLDDDFKLLLVNTPNVPENEIHQALPWLVKDLIDYPVKEATIDAFPLPFEGSKAEKLYTVIAKTIDLKELREIVDACNLMLTHVVIPELSLLPIIKLLDNNNGSIGIVYIKGNQIEFIMANNGQLYFSRKVGDISQLEDEAKHSSVHLELQRSIDYCQVELHLSAISDIYMVPQLQPLHDSASSLTCNAHMIDMNNLNENLNEHCLITFGELLSHDTTD